LVNANASAIPIATTNPVLIVGFCATAARPTRTRAAEPP
jgi:hypothetical protein